MKNHEVRKCKNAVEVNNFWRNQPYKYKKIKIQHVKNIGKYLFNEVIFDKTYTFKIESDNLCGDNGLIM